VFIILYFAFMFAVYYAVVNYKIMPNSTFRPVFSVKDIDFSGSFKLGDRYFIDSHSRFEATLVAPLSGHVHVVLEQQDPDLDFSVMRWSHFPRFYELFSKKHLELGEVKKGKLSTIKFQPAEVLKWVTTKGVPGDGGHQDYITSKATPGHYWLLVLIMGGEWDKNKPALPKTKKGEEEIQVYAVSRAVPIVLVDDLERYIFLNYFLIVCTPVFIFLLYLLFSPSEKKLEELSKW
jgi:hypothetical protein